MAALPVRPHISRRRSDSGQDVLVVDIPDGPPEVDARALGRLLGEGPAGARRPVSEQLVVDDPFFELALDELIAQAHDDRVAVLQCTSQTAGIRSVPDCPEDPARPAREERHLRAVFAGQA